MLTYHLSYVLCIAAELLYPTYASFKAIQTETAQDDMQWLTFWIVNSFIRTFEVALRPIVQWIPLYYELRLGLYIWLIAPQTMGALYLYENYISPFLSKYGAELDPVFAKTTRFVQKAGAAAAKMHAAAKADPGVSDSPNSARTTNRPVSGATMELGLAGSLKPTSSDGFIETAGSMKATKMALADLGGGPGPLEAALPGKVKAN